MKSLEEIDNNMMQESIIINSTKFDQNQISDCRE